MKGKLVFRGTLLAGFIGAAVVVTQFVQVLKASDAAREVAINAWVESNPGQSDAVERYRENCTKAPPFNDLKDPPKRPVSFVECAESSGNPSLAAAIVAASDSVEIPAPLRWLLGA